MDREMTPNLGDDLTQSELDYERTFRQRKTEDVAVKAFVSVDQKAIEQEIKILIEQKKLLEKKKTLDREILGDTIEDISKYLTDRLGEHQRLILAAMLFNSCTPGKTDYSVFTDTIDFKAVLSRKPK